MNVASVTSPNDDRLQDYREITDAAALQRKGLFVAEGRFVVERLVAQRRFDIHSILLSTTAFDALSSGPLQHTRAPVLVVDQRVMNDIVGFNIHRGCLALAHRPATRTLDDLALATLQRVVVLEGVNNPDNVGGIFRSAAAFGVDAVVLGPACGDPLYRKAIRTSMAATLQVPFADAGAWPEALAVLRENGIRVLALSTNADARPLEQLPAPDRGRTAILVGNEGEGLTAAAMAAADDRVRIRMSSAVDSLNVTVAASIAMYDAF